MVDWKGRYCEGWLRISGENEEQEEGEGEEEGGRGRTEEDRMEEVRMRGWNASRGATMPIVCLTMLLW